jgi:hypothetical protein
MISVTELVRGMKDVRTAALPAMLIGIVALGAYVFLELADDIGEEEIGAIDRALLLAFRNPADFSDPLGPVWLQEFVTEITSLGGYPILVALVATVAGYLIVARKYGPALFVVLSTGLGTVVSQLLKLAYERPRPDLVDHLERARHDERDRVSHAGRADRAAGRGNAGASLRDERGSAAFGRGGAFPHLSRRPLAERRSGRLGAGRGLGEPFLARRIGAQGLAAQGEAAGRSAGLSQNEAGDESRPRRPARRSPRIDSAAPPARDR